MQEILLTIRYFERELSKSLKKVNFIFSFEPQSLLMVKIMKNKRSMKLVTSRSRLQNKFKKILLLAIYYLTKFDDVILSYSKNYTSQFINTNYSTVICPFESGKCGGKLQKFEYLENEKSFLDEIKSIFLSF